MLTAHAEIFAMRLDTILVLEFYCQLVKLKFDSFFRAVKIGKSLGEKNCREKMTIFNGSFLLIFEMSFLRVAFGRQFSSPYRGPKVY